MQKSLKVRLSDMDIDSAALQHRARDLLSEMADAWTEKQFRWL